MPQLSDKGPLWAKSWATLGTADSAAGADGTLLIHLQDPTGSIGLTNCKYLDFQWQRSSGSGRSDGIDALAVFFVIAGEALVDAAGHTHPCRAGAGVAVDLAQDCAVRSGSAVTTETCVLFLPRTKALVPSIALRNGLPISSETLAGGLLAAALVHLSGRCGAIEPGDLTNLALPLTSLAAAVMQESLDPAVKWGRELRMSRIIKFIESNLASQQLEPDLIAGHFAMSRATLYRMFEPLGGVAGFIRERRLSRAMADLASAGSPTRSVAAAGRKAGYPDAASFSRAFRNHFGMPPAAAARLRKPSAAHESKGQNANTPGTGSKTLAGLLRELSTRRA